VRRLPDRPLPDPEQPRGRRRRTRSAGIYRWPNPNFHSGALDIRGPYRHPFWEPWCSDWRKTTGCGVFGSWLSPCQEQPTDGGCWYILVGQKTTFFYSGWNGQRPDWFKPKLRWRSGVLYGRVCGDFQTCNTFLPDTLQRWGTVSIDASHAYFPPVPLARATKVIVKRGAGDSVEVIAVVRCSASRLVRSCLVGSASGGPTNFRSAIAYYVSGPRLIARGATRELPMRLRFAGPPGAKPPKNFAAHARRYARAWTTATQATIATQECDTRRPNCERRYFPSRNEGPSPSLVQDLGSRTVAVVHDH
jgi:hypothetical protein